MFDLFATFITKVTDDNNAEDIHTIIQKSSKAFTVLNITDLCDGRWPCT